MTTIEGVWVGAGSAVIAFLIAKFEIITKVYSFLKELFGEKPGVKFGDVTGSNIGDVAGRDLNKRLYDHSQRRSGDVYNVGSGSSIPLLERKVRMLLPGNDRALQAQLGRIWTERSSSDDGWFTEYIDAVVNSEEFLEQIATTQKLYAPQGWELKSIDGFDNSFRNGVYGFHYQMTFVKAVPVPVH